MTGKAFFIEIRNDGVYVSLAAGKEKYVTAAEVLNELRLKGINNYEKQAINKLLLTRSGNWIKVADGSDIPKNGDVYIVVSEDESEAQVMVLPPQSDGERFTAEAVFSRLKEKGIVYGIETESICALMAEFKDLPVFFSVKGKPCVHGEDARIDYLVEDSLPKLLQPEDPLSKLDFKNLHLVSNVEADQPLAIKIPATEGEDGISVTGKVLTANKGRDNPLPAGEGTRIGEDGLTLYSTLAGMVKLTSGKISVLPVLTLKEDVDYRTGNVNFIGTVMVLGDIREGFSVQAEGDVNVAGVVEGASILCKGDLRVKGGIQGMGKATIKADGEIAARYIDQSWVRSGKGIYISDAITHSNVGCDGEIVIRGGRKAQLVGGTTALSGNLSCNIIGSKMGTHTEVSAGVPPALKEWNEELRERLATLTANIKRLDITIKHYETLEGISGLKPEDKITYQMAAKTKIRLSQELECTEESLLEVKKQIAEHYKNIPTIKVASACYPGVTFNLGGHTKEIKVETKGISVVVMEDRIFVFDRS